MPDDRKTKTINATQNETEALDAVLYAMRLLEKVTAYGEIVIVVSDGEIKDVKVQHFIRPSHKAPWRDGL